MVNVKKIKQKVLDLAIKGELVFHEASSCDAKRICKETIKCYINNLNGKKSKYSLTIADEERPFNIPETWSWIRIGFIGEVGMGQTILSSDLSESGNPVYSATMSDDYFGCIDPSLNRIKLKKGDIIIPARGTIGYVKCAKEDNSTCTQTTMYIKPFDTIYKKWLYFALLARKKDIFEHGGMAIPQVTIGVIGNELIPIPPLNEQKRIVSKLEDILGELNEIDKIQHNLIPIKYKLKNKVLDVALRGKLVKQVAKEGTGESLFKQIQIKKQSLNMKSKNKAAKAFLPIASDDTPFEIPPSWKWVRLSDICEIPITDGTHQTPTYSTKENGVPFLSSKDVTTGKINWSNVKYITKDLHKELYKRIAPHKDDVLLAKNGTTGVAALVEENKIFDIYVTLAVLRPVKNMIFPKYLLNVVNSPVCKNQFNEHLIGIGVPNLHLNVIKEVLIPLPPYEEQKRIVSKIEQIFKTLE